MLARLAKSHCLALTATGVPSRRTNAAEALRRIRRPVEADDRIGQVVAVEVAGQLGKGVRDCHVSQEDPLPGPMQRRTPVLVEVLWPCPARLRPATMWVWLTR